MKMGICMQHRAAMGVTLEDHPLTHAVGNTQKLGQCASNSHLNRSLLQQGAKATLIAMLSTATAAQPMRKKLPGTLLYLQTPSSAAVLADGLRPAPLLDSADTHVSKC